MTTSEYWLTIGTIALGLAITVPLGLYLLGLHLLGLGPSASPRRAMWFAIALGSAIGSLVVPAGAAAAAAAAPWVGVATGATARAAHIAWRRRSIASIGATIATAWWLNAALWLLAHRSGIEPLGFDRTTALFTVAHFHHAGFGLTALLVVSLGRSASTTRICTAAGHQVGMVLVAAGITFDDRLEVVGAVVLTIALGGWAHDALTTRQRSRDGRVRALLAVSAAAWIVPMTLAIAWAAQPFLPQPLVTTVAVMLTLHAVINAIGLIIAGLLAHLVLAANETTAHIDPATDPITSSSTRSRPSHAHVHTTLG